MRFSRGQKTLVYAGSTTIIFLIFLSYVYYNLSLDANSLKPHEFTISDDGVKNWFRTKSKAADLRQDHSKIAPRIWQMDKSPFLSTWQTMNPGYRFELVIDSAADSIVEEIGRQHLPALSQVYADITTPILKWDFLRYLILWQYGGYYSDTDATPIKPIKEWIPPDYDESSISTLIGLEVDEPDLVDPAKIEEMRFTSNLQFCQWMLVSKPKHEILENVINSIMTDVTAFNNVAPSRMEILETTGPGAYTRAVKKYLHERVPSFDVSTLFRIQEPVQVADILFLPQHSFAYYGSYSSGPREAENEQAALIYHNLAGSWKTAENEPISVSNNDIEMSSDEVSSGD